MSLTYNKQLTWLNANLNTNGVGAITGAKANQALISYMLTQFKSIVHDTTRPYLIGDICSVTDGDFTDLYLCIEDTTGAFNSAKWTRINVRKKAITANLNGSDVVTHGLGFKPINVYVESSTGENIPFNVTQSDATTITFNTLDTYTDAIINLIA